ncbi:DUF5522 domain-containing protein [Thermus scotoductus]|uniref:DUF5522 domain-containing protein n=1 Tax=Thermus scotoductus TaxID=37636 RepID=UPI001562B1EE|nr:DUF5522 domain-containing protein [Thermus scotoductus]
MKEREEGELKEGEDFYWENGWLVFTEDYHRKRGYCCGSGCRHCPWRGEEKEG